MEMLENFLAITAVDMTILTPSIVIFSAERLFIYVFLAFYTFNFLPYTQD
jgi:hypothetical protein